MKTHTPEQELDILNTIHQNENSTQRELSDQVGLSLGAINILLKKLTEKGLLKIEKLNSNSIKYFLTPAGIADKIERTTQYIARTYKEVMSLQLSIKEALEDLITDQNRETLLFYGPDDEIKQVITTILREEFSLTHTQIFTDIDKLQLAANRQRRPYVYTWNIECEQLMKKTHIKCVNIMDRVVI